MKQSNQQPTDAAKLNSSDLTLNSLSQPCDLWEGDPAPPAKKRRKKKRFGKGQPFISVPISCEALKIACGLSMSAARCYLACLHLQSMNRQSTFRFSAKFWGIDRQQRRRGLLALEDAGLIQVAWKHGSLPVVTLRDITSEQ